MSPSTRPAGVLLTGGGSRRLGTDKALLRLADGVTLAARAAATLGAVCGDCVEVGEGISGLRAVREAPPGGGPLAALLAGVEALATAGPVVLFGCDYPRVDVAALRAIAEAAPTAATAIARDTGGRLHYVCARYGTDAIGEARARFEAGERALRWIELLAHVTVALPSGVLVDLDTPADAAALGIRLDPAP